jgi:hypothetical protein
VTDCLSWQILQTTHAKAGSLAAVVSAAGIQHLLVVLGNTAAAHIVVEIGSEGAARLIVLVLVVEHTSSAAEPAAEDTRSAVEPVVADMSSVAVSGRNYLSVTPAGCTQSGDQVVERRIVLRVEAVRAVAHHNLQYVGTVRAVAHRNLPWIEPGWEFAHVPQAAVARIVAAGWAGSYRMAQVHLEEVGIAILAVVAAAVDSTVVAAVAVAEGSCHHHSCTLAVVVCRTGMEAGVTSTLRAETHSLVVL